MPQPGDGRQAGTRDRPTRRARKPLAMQAYQRATQGSKKTACSARESTDWQEQAPRRKRSTRAHQEATPQERHGAEGGSREAPTVSPSSKPGCGGAGEH